MGYFDDDDDEGEESQNHSSILPSKSSGNIDTEEEDPLDAYMKTLESAPQNVQSHEKNSRRFDNESNELEGEDDWHDLADKPRARSASGVSETESDTEQNALLATFRKGRSEAGTHGDEAYEPAKSLRDLPPPPVPKIEKAILTLDDSTMGRRWRHETSVTLSALRNGTKKWTIDPILQFSQLDAVLPESGVAQLVSDYPSPTAVQSQTIGVSLTGRDAVVTAATGQGKTLAFMVSALCHLTRQPTSLDPGVVVLVPTRELALQVEKQSKTIVKACGFAMRALIGGQGKWKMMQDLKQNRNSGGLQIAIATPGRLLDVASTKKGISLQSTTFVVLDEADKMLQLGFGVQVRRVLEQIRADRQTLMLSATMGRKVEQLTFDWLHPDAVRISVGRTGESSQNVNQQVMVLPSDEAKMAFLLEMMPVFQGLGRSIVFVATRDGCETLANTIREQTGSCVLTLHADKHQSDRSKAMRSFRKGDVQTLVATDIAARGLDIPNVQTVISFDPAKNLDSHVHRIGRAGRLSKESSATQVGSAYTLLTHRNSDFANVLRNAFEREGREITPELEGLANSRKTGINASRGKAGLGYEGGVGIASSSNGSEFPPKKRSRWG